MTRFDRPRPWLTALLLWLVATMPAVSAPEPPAVLASLLPRLPSVERQRLQRQASRWAQWTPAERAGFAARAAAWDALPPLERAERRARYRAWQALPAAERVRIGVARQELATLPGDLQQALRTRFATLDASERRGWRLGPELGADYPALQPLLAQVPAGEHAILLQVLRGMSPIERAALAALVQRTPPAERERLRRELESTSADQRRAWLLLRLEQ